MGNAFTKPEDRLPLTLRGPDGKTKVGFIVVGLQHMIENNEWITKIRGQMIKLRDPANIIGAAEYAEQQAVLAAGADGITSANLNRTDPNNACYTPPWVAQKKTISVSAATEKGRVMLEEYRPAFPAGQTKGLQALLEAQTWVEGFRPGTVAYTNNNPGNVGTNTNKNSDGTVSRISGYKTLKEGIQAQIDLLKRVIAGTTKSYPADPTLYEYLTLYDPPCFRDKVTKQFIRVKNTPEDISAYTNLVLAYLEDRGITGVDGNTRLSAIIAKN